MRKRLEKYSDGKINWSIYSLLAIILFHLINNFIWLHLDNTYLFHESYNHFLLSAKVFYYLQQQTFPWLSDILGGVGYFRWHGVLVGYLTAPFYFIFGLTQDSGVMVNSSIFLTILVFSTFGIGKVIFDKRAGLLAAFLVSMYPLVFNHLRVYLLDIPLTSMVALAVLLLLKSENLTNKKYSCLFAVASGFGLLIKFNFVLFILGPLSMALYKIFKKNIFKQAKWNMTIIVFILILLSFGFYRLKFGEVAGRIVECSWLSDHIFYRGDSLASILQRWLILGKDYLPFLLQDCFNNSVLPVFFILFLFGVFTFDGQRKILFIWLALPLFFLAFFFHYPNFNRYFMPVLPAMALISSAGIMALKSVKLRRTLVILVVVLGCLQYFAISYRMDFIPEQIQIKIPLFDAKRFIPITLFRKTISIGYRSDEDSFSYPAETNWKNEGILTEIIKNIKNPREKEKIFFIGNQNIVRIYDSIMYKLLVEKSPLLNMLLFISSRINYEDMLFDPYKLTSADFVVLIKEKRANQYLDSFLKSNLDKMNILFDRNIDKFKLIKELSFDSGDSILLYKRNSRSYSQIAKPGLELYFRDGAVKIFYWDLEITNAIGLEASFILSQDYYSNSYFQWSSVVLAPDRMVIYAKEENLPLLMKWDIEIKNNHEIGWTVSMDAVPLDKVSNLCLSLFVTEKYTQWESSLGKGSFAPENMHTFAEIKLPGLKTRSIILFNSKEKNLPKVMFSTDNPSDVLPFVKWRDNLKAVGFYINTNSKSLEKQSIFSGTISFP